MRILGIETSCDETAISLLKTSGPTAIGGTTATNFSVLGQEVASQVGVHKEWGGVVPMLAKREHHINLPLMLERILNLSPDTKNLPPDLIAVTYGPGLEPALWEGINFAKELATKWGIPLVPTDHMHGHIVSALLKQNSKGKNQSAKLQFKIENPEFPAVALLISGGHTELVLLKDLDSFEILGRTRDDAVGEAFDKVARILGLPYPGGPEISRLASRYKLQVTDYKLPRPMLHSDDLDFSFSGLKTAVLYLVKKIGELTEEQKISIAYEFEQAVTEVLVKKTLEAIDKYAAKSLLVGGGVIANKTIRESFTLLSRGQSARSGLTIKFGLYLPEMELTGDNATMIAVAGYFRSQDKNTLLQPGSKPFDELKANGNLSLYK